MKKILILTIFIIGFTQAKSFGQGRNGNTLNLGVGFGGYYGYYGSVGHSVPVFHIDYEFNVAQNFTLAPFLNIHSYTRNYYWGNKHYPYRHYYYKETVIPIGVKGTYYFDDLLHVHSKWDIYMAGSLGLSIVNSHWDEEYYGERDVYRRPNPLFLDLHIGTEYHFTDWFGMFLDISTGVSTIGIALHGK